MFNILSFLFVLNIFLSGEAKHSNGNTQTRSDDVRDVVLRFYNGETVDKYQDFWLMDSENLLNSAGFDLEQPTVLYAHGYIENATVQSVLTMAAAYRENRPATNFVLIDWSNMADGSYNFNAAPNTKKVGTATAHQINELIKKGLKLDKLHLIGHSLGGHVSGFIGRVLKNSYGLVVPRITGLDPAFPKFYPKNLLLKHLQPGDAEFVDIIHTDARGYGAPFSTGDLDFWPNGGRRIQPGCPLFAPLPLSDGNLCSHWRSWIYYAESVKNSRAFPAIQARNNLQFLRLRHNPCRNPIYMGIDVDKSAKGSYYLTTNRKAPFGKGTC